LLSARNDNKSWAGQDASHVYLIALSTRRRQWAQALIPGIMAAKATARHQHTHFRCFGGHSADRMTNAMQSLAGCTR
jgi:hypothetical protein